MGNRVIVVSQHMPGWRWHERHVPELTWEFFDDHMRSAFPQRFCGVNLPRIRGCLAAVMRARRTKAALLVAHGPTETALVATLAKILRVPAPIVAFSFNYAELPIGRRKPWLDQAFRGVDRFIVYSTTERQLYARYFGLPESRFETVLWSVSPPVPTAGGPIEPGDYVAAIGGNARDYPLLIESARLVPEIPFVLVVRPHNLTGLSVPPHVRVRVNLPLGDAMNILQYSRFMALPLKSSEVPCGHVTLVAAMHLSKAIVITGSSGVADYVVPEKNAVTVPAGDATAFASAMRRCWHDPAHCAALGREGQHFASERCSEVTAIQHLRGLLARYLPDAFATPCPLFSPRLQDSQRLDERRALD